MLFTVMSLVVIPRIRIEKWKTSMAKTHMRDSRIISWQSMSTMLHVLGYSYPNRHLYEVHLELTVSWVPRECKLG